MDQVYLVRHYADYGGGITIGATRSFEDAKQFNEMADCIAVPYFIPKTKALVVELFSNNEINQKKLSHEQYRSITALLEEIVCVDAWDEYNTAKGKCSVGSFEPLNQFCLKYIDKLPDSLFL